MDSHLLVVILQQETLNTVKAAGKRGSVPNKENELPSTDAAKRRRTSTGSQGSVAASTRPATARGRGSLCKIAEKKEEPEPVRTSGQ